MNEINNLKLLLKNIKILYIEDDEEVNDIVSEVLESFSDYVVSAYDGESAWELYLEHKPNIIITDIKMPKLNGIDLVSKIREIEKDRKTHIIFTTAYSDEEFLLKAANLNIQGYIIKPITYRKLKDSLFKLFETLHNQQTIIFKLNEQLQYDIDNGFLIYNKEQIHLNNKERKLISLLIENHKRVVSYDEIENIIWTCEDECMSESALRTLIKNIRKKSPTKIIKNISKQGYKIVVS
ncbi:MAG: response regulator transcription factor [Campylobacterota bacterium]|nr:response regulator transcription factor [Campylobacterota bacterium]